MNILFFYAGVPSPIFETELELINTHAINGDNVNVIICNSDLPNCFWNPQKSKAICRVCCSKRENGFKLLNEHKNIRYYYFKNIEITKKVDFPNTLDELLNFHYDNENLGKGVVSRLISLFRDHRFSISKNQEQVKLELNSAIQSYENLKHYFKLLSPNLVYVFNGRVTNFMPAILLCNKFSINYNVYEVANTSNRYLLRFNSTTHSMEKFVEEMEYLWQIHPNPSLRDINAQQYFKDRKIRKSVEKAIIYTKNQTEGLLPKGFNSNKKNIAIFNCTIDEYAAFDEWKNKVYEPDETVGIKMIVQSFKDNPEYMFYLRVHPNMKNLPRTTSQLSDIEEIERNNDNLKVIWPESKIDSYKLIDACDKVVVFGSTIGIESAYWNKPTILAGKAFYENLGCVYKVSNHEELVNLLSDNLLKPLNNLLALKYANRELNHGIDYKFFAETNFNNHLANGKFNGVEIKPNLIPIIILQLTRIINYVFKILKWKK